MYTRRLALRILAILAAGAVTLAVTALASALGSGPVPARDSGSVTLKPHCGDGRSAAIEVIGHFVDSAGNPVGPGSYARIYFDGILVARSVPVDAGGNIDTSITTPSDPADGTHQVRTDVVYDVDLPPLSLTAPYTVPCAPPQLVDDPAVVARAPAGEDVQLTGTGWDAGVPVALDLDGSLLPAATPNSDGQFSMTVHVNAQCGAHTFTGAQTAAGRTRTATAALTVTCGRTQLRLQPDVVPTGFTTHVQGAGFTPGAPVALSWVLLDHSAEPADCGPAVSADADGSFDVYCLLLPNDRVGHRSLLAQQTGGTAGSADCLVVTNPDQPALGGQLIGRR